MATDLKHLQKKLLKVKKELKDWEFVFQRKHHRPPTVQDIGDRPNVEKYYKKYNQLKRDYKHALDCADSSRLQPLPTSTMVKPSSSHTIEKEDNKMTEEEAFWLGGHNTSMSQPTTTSATKIEEERLILGGSQPIQKKNIMLEQKLFGHLMIQNPRKTATMEPPIKEEVHVTTSTTTILNTQDIVIHDDSDDDMMEDVQIVNRQPDHFRHYNSNDLPLSIGPGFFNSSKVAYNIPLFDDENERQRRERILYKLEKGTLGEALEENFKMENEMDDDIREFISKYNNNILHESSNNEEISSPSSSQPSSPFDASSSSSQYNNNNSKYYPNKPYKKKPIQRRQTRLYKLKFVETR